MTEPNELDCPCIPAELRDRAAAPTSAEVFPADPCNGTGHTRLAWKSQKTHTCAEGTAHRIYEVTVLPCPTCDPEEYQRVSKTIAEHA